MKCYREGFDIKVEIDTSYLRRLGIPNTDSFKFYLQTTSYRLKRVLRDQRLKFFKLKFAQRVVLLTLIFLGLSGVLFYYVDPFSVPSQPLPVGFSSNGIKSGLFGNPWQARSLQGINEIKRNAFSKFYDDSRRYYANGDGDHPEPLSKDTSPFELKKFLKTKREVLWKSDVKEVISSHIISSDTMRSTENLKRLFIAADNIRKQVNMTSLGFKSILDIHKKVLYTIPKIQEYGSRFKLGRKEKYALQSAIPHDEIVAERQKINERRVTDFMEVPDKYIKKYSKRTGWYAFYTDITRYNMYSEGSRIEVILKELALLDVVKMTVTKPGRIRPRLRLTGNLTAYFSPVLTTRTQERLPDHLHDDDLPRHTSEIAAFHLDRVLGFRRASPCIGRTFSLTKQLIPNSAKVYQTHGTFVSLRNNVCIETQPKQPCKRCHPGEQTVACGNPDTIEGSMILDVYFLNVTKVQHPWRRPESPNEPAAWELEPDFCTDVREDPTYREGRRLLDIIDLAIFDFLQGNPHRQTYRIFKIFGQDTFIHHDDNEFGFARAYKDEITILAPLYQCCTIRFSTFQTLLNFESGPTRLSDLMKDSLSRDPLAPVLLDQHLLALDRRVSIILKLVYECMSLYGNHVVEMDGF